MFDKSTGRDRNKYYPYKRCQMIRYLLLFLDIVCFFAICCNHNVFLRLILQLNFCRGIRMQINDYQVTDESSSQHVQWIEDHPMFSEVEPQTDEYNYVASLMSHTFSTAPPMGKDARNLDHIGLKITGIFRIQNNILKRKYIQERSKIDPETINVSQVLRRKKTKTLRLRNDFFEVLRRKRLAVDDRAGQAEGQMDQDDDQMDHADGRESEGDDVIVRLTDEDDVMSKIKAPTKKHKRWNLFRYLHGRLTKKKSYDDDDDDSTFGTSFTESLDESLQEVVLFHGTKIHRTITIAQQGFHKNFYKNGYFGRGVYFAECSKKADQYADPINNRRLKNLSMFMVRATLGNTWDWHGKGTADIFETLGNAELKEYHCVVAGLQNLFREFLMLNTTVILPEYLILYDRIIYDTSSV